MHGFWLKILGFNIKHGSTLLTTGFSTARKGCLDSLTAGGTKSCRLRANSYQGTRKVGAGYNP
jgi:hypothetical protein